MWQIRVHDPPLTGTPNLVVCTSGKNALGNISLFGLGEHGRFYKEAGVDAIKLEGGRRVTKAIEAIVDAGMVVCGHVGLTPQSTGQFGGYKAQRHTAESGYEVIKDAGAVQEAGVSPFKFLYRFPIKRCPVVKGPFYLSHLRSSI